MDRLEFDKAQAADIAEVIRRLRPEDVREFAAWGFRPQDTVGAFAEIEERVVAIWNGSPVFIFGITEPVAGTAQLWGFATSEMADCGRAITKYVQQVYKPRLFEKLGVRRLEARVPYSAHHSVKWLRYLGMNVETALPHFSKFTQEPFLLLAYTIDDFNREYEDDQRVLLQTAPPGNANGSGADAHLGGHSG